MQPVQSTTGHSPAKERKVARALYITIAIAVVAGLAMFFIMGKNRTDMNPYQTNETNTAAPDTAPGTQERPGTVPDPAAPNQDR
ncbi:MAG: hypothetical protein EOP04_29445 [Proteobacteria bacterium]|nr:MAG: hypothetical protein EOP04_29445 [Pseudomonadota bacterium]